MKSLKEEQKTQSQDRRLISNDWVSTTRILSQSNGLVSKFIAISSSTNKTFIQYALFDTEKDICYFVFWHLSGQNWQREEILLFKVHLERIEVSWSQTPKWKSLKGLWHGQKWLLCFQIHMTQLVVSRYK